jgi:hypothetical protein
VPKFLRWVLILVVLLPALDFALANRGMVWVSVDPVSGDEPGLHMPLFAAVFLFVLIGVLLGGAAAWLNQAKWRRLAREREREIEDLKRQIEDRHAYQAMASIPGEPLPAVSQDASRVP